MADRPQTRPKRRQIKSNAWRWSTTSNRPDAPGRRADRRSEPWSIWISREPAAAWINTAGLGAAVPDESHGGADLGFRLDAVPRVKRQR